MSATIHVPITDQRRPLGDAYARTHLTTPSKAAVLCCEGACLRGEIARRAANLVTHRLAPQRAVRICHGGLLEASGGMKDLVCHADKILVLDGCGMACGSRLVQGAMPGSTPIVVYTDALCEFDRSKFALNDMASKAVDRLARHVAQQVVALHLA